MQNLGPYPRPTESDCNLTRSLDFLYAPRDAVFPAGKMQVVDDDIQKEEKEGRYQNRR